ncbi:nucleotidyltransferase domain-containing protein (plasmid) [Cereibacter azotoformans]|uniref:GSU2403 family nucleotidyltransferase fold protein n=1 Tax=Cereibacter azotoformans TaxID=43057 RepID=UPI000E35C921|nr:nucleotidyltransferase domain-containing protein [Cereibacter azotoformans]AXQ96144.1 hypothetical protein D0Z66_20770 [Cereibacter sphaeroides]UIJ32984.1 nucleotidyltransferase domain-containing protein [Cereibacter azotoformans]ULB12251.1 nucleotidyltransferase domain-containing protein [Cereibacter azotoformans]
MMNYSDLDARTVRERIDMAQLWDAWIAADDLRRHSFRGSVGWEVRNGRDYLYSRKRGVVKSLGPRSPDTERIHLAFHQGRDANKARLASLSAEMNQQAAVLRALNAGRLPIMAARTLRALRIHDKSATIRVIGTNALYAYESLAGVMFNSASTATGDVDIPVDDRNRLRLLTETDERIGLTRLVQRTVDKSFQSRGTMEFRLTNDKGYMIEFLRPEPPPIYRSMPGADPLEAGDIRPAPIAGLQWLVNAPAVDVVVLDERGFPAPMRCPDPRYWAVHKLWLSARETREPQKKIRDRQQADVMAKLIGDKLPQLPFDERFRRMLPRELARMLEPSPIATRTNPSW